MTHSYDDIIDLPCPERWLQPRMTRQERAMQFAAFDALTGFGDEVADEARHHLELFEPEAQDMSVLSADLQPEVVGLSAEEYADFLQMLRASGFLKS